MFHHDISPLLFVHYYTANNSTKKYFLPGFLGREYAYPLKWQNAEVFDSLPFFHWTKVQQLL
jgi:hypothetical protein